MRWKQPSIGDMRTVKKFLLLPRTMEEETRWLEMATFRQRYKCDDYGIIRWTNFEWIDEEECGYDNSRNEKMD